MPKILLTNKYSKKVLAIVKEQLPCGYEFISLENADKIELLKKAPQAEYFLASGRVNIDKEIIEAAYKLKMVQRTGVGTDTIDLSALKEKGIPLYVNAGINAISVAEHTIMLILSVLRRLTAIDAGVKDGKWERNDMGVECSSLKGKTVGIFGAGNIGKTVVKMLEPFSVTIIYYDPLRLPEAEEKKLNIKYCELSDLLKQADILSLHCPLTPQNRNIIGVCEIASMKQEAVIINTARGPLIDEDALAEALKSAHIKGAGLDVFYNEPPKQDNPLFKLNNVILTPHIGGLTFESYSKMIKDAFENIRLFEEGQLELIKDKRIQ